MGENPIATRSKKKLIDTLEKFLSDKPYEEITITELCQKANLSRPAFYQNFYKVDNVLLQLIEDKLQRSSSYSCLNAHTIEGFTETSVKIANENRAFISILLKNDLEQFFVYKFTQVLMKLETVTDGYLDSSDIAKHYYKRYIASTAANVLAEWVKQDNQSLEEITKLISGLLKRPFF